MQPKAIAHPTDSRLYWKALTILVRQAKRHGIALRQSHMRLAKAAVVRAGRYAHARQFRRMRRALKQLRTYLGRVYRDIGRKIAGDTAPEARPPSVPFRLPRTEPIVRYQFYIQQSDPVPG